MINGKHKVTQIILLVLVLLVSGSLQASTVKAKQGENPAILPAITLLINSSNVVALGSGGELWFPDGSLPQGAEVKVQKVMLPMLTDDLIAVGSAYRIIVEKQPTIPVKVTMPVPAGENIDNLILVRRESHGRITLLQTDVENGKLVALTPGFSILSAARLTNNLNGALFPKISGPDILPINTQGQYSEQNYDKYLALSRKWRVYEYNNINMGANLTIDSQAMTNSLALLSAKKPGLLNLTFTITEPKTGLNAFASKNVSIVNSLETGDKLDLDVYGPNIVVAKESFNLKTVVLNTDRPDIIHWSWTMGSENGFCDNCSEDSLLKSFVLPYDGGGTRIVTFTISARSSNGILGTTKHTITVLDDEEIKITSFNRSPNGDLIWDKLHPNVLINYEATIGMGGHHEGNPPYDYNWFVKNHDQAYHTNSFQRTDTFNTSVNQPGTYHIELNAIDTDDDKDTSQGTFSVGGQIPEDFSLTGLPAESVHANKSINATLRAWGGVMHLNGKFCPDYVYWVDWGDGTDFDTGELASINPSDKYGVNLDHIYAKPGTYIVRYYAMPKECIFTPHSLSMSIHQDPDSFGAKTASITVDEALAGDKPCALLGLPGSEIVTWKGRQWQRCDIGYRQNWYKAAGVYHADLNPDSIDVCGDLILDGHSGWRLPTQNELRSLIVCTNGNGPIVNWPDHPYYCGDGNDGSYDHPTIDVQFSIRSQHYWSSSVTDEGYAEYVGFYDGVADSTPRSIDNPYYNNYVRCVR